MNNSPLKKEEFAGELISRADELFDAENYAGALQMYESALEEVDSSRLRASLIFSIGRCHEKMGKPHEAHDFLRRAFHEDPTNENIDTYRARLAEELELKPNNS